MNKNGLWKISSDKQNMREALKPAPIFIENESPHAKQKQNNIQLVNVSHLLCCSSGLGVRVCTSVSVSVVASISDKLG